MDIRAKKVLLRDLRDLRGEENRQSGSDFSARSFARCVRGTVLLAP